MTAEHPPLEEGVGAAPPGPLLSRRAVIGGLAASGLTAGVIGSLLTACTDASSSGTEDHAPDPAPTAAEAALIRIGRRYRQERPEEDDRTVLRRRLGIETAAAASPGLLRSLDAQVAADYGAGRTIQLDGWVLSVTEGRAAALVSLA